MATIDEILGGVKTPTGRDDTVINEETSADTKLTAGNAKGNDADELSKKNDGQRTKPIIAYAQKPTALPSSVAGASASGGGGGGFEELFKQLNPYTPPTAEEVEKEKKKRRRDELFAAIGDGISALSNLYFTTKGAPNMYTGKNTMSEKTKVRYDKLVKDREEKNTAYYNGLMRARQADAENAHRERSWQRQLRLDQEARDRYNESIAHRNERERIADERYNNEQEYKRGRDEEAYRRWQATFDENKRRFDRSHNFQVRQHNDNVSVRREQARATAARGVRGKRLGFADGNGNQVGIYENVWKGSMQQVYDVLYADMIDAHNKDKTNNPRVPYHKTQREKEDFVKQNWHKSPKAKAQMLALSKLDPATMTSELNDDVEEYTPGGGDDEVIDYTPGKKD